MKKLLIVLLVLLVLTGCKKKENDSEEPLTFQMEETTYTFVSTLDDGYDLYRNGEESIELITEDNITTMYYTPEEDIYQIVIDADNIVVFKNGNIIISCARDTEICTGFEVPTFRDDLYDIGDLFN